MFDSFITYLEASSGYGQQICQQLKACDAYVMTIGFCQRCARDEPGKKDHKQSIMQKLMQEPKHQFLPNGIAQVPLPLEPSKMMTGLNPGTFLLTVIKSL